jgi:hypothetical protein
MRVLPSKHLPRMSAVPTATWSEMRDGVAGTPGLFGTRRFPIPATFGRELR